LHPAVEELMEVVEIALSDTTSGFFLCLGDSHAHVPSIVFTNRLNEVSIMAGNYAGKVSGSAHDVEAGVLAIAIGCIAAFIRGDLHETMAITT